MTIKFEVFPHFLRKSWILGEAQNNGKLRSKFQRSKVRDTKSIRSIVRFWYFFETENHLERFLNLWFFCVSISSNSLLYLKGSEFYPLDSSFSQRMEHYTSRLSHIDTIGNISEEKKFFHSCKYWLVDIKELTEILGDKEKPLSKRESSRSTNHSEIKNTKMLPFFFEKSKTRRRGSWVNTEKNHDLDYREKSKKISLISKNNLTNKHSLI